MRRILTNLMLLALMLGPACMGAELRDHTSSNPTPPLELEDLNGQQHSLEDYRGKVLLVNFWASWCPPCIHEMPGLKRLRQKLEGQPFEILAVNVGEKKYKVWKFAKLVSFDLPILLDTGKDTFQSWGVEVLPTSFLVDANGRVRYRVQGDLKWDSEDIVEQIETIINEQENTE